MSVLVITDPTAPNQPDHALCTTITAAKQLGPVTLLLAGSEINEMASRCELINGVDSVLFLQDEQLEKTGAEQLVSIILSLKQRYRHILAPATTFGKDLLPRLAAKLGVDMLSDVVQILDSERFVRPLFAGNVYQTIQHQHTPTLLTIRPTAFSPALMGEQPAERHTISKPKKWPRHSNHIALTQPNTDRPDLGSAEIVVAGGAGVNTEQGWQQLGELADKLGAALGATRSAVDAGFAPNTWQIGQTGRIIAPRLYIAVGISGAIQHLAGIKDAGTIVAINKDPKAPICSIADYTLSGMMEQIIPEWIRV
ncbi:MAG: electron transfer flavoprotein subunit alpha/FixB family protein [Magnetococcales bacterium]|nr:electron transfer flavoprotein subunit alpha/FixB family protein [Magnetococcales bacterium]